MNTGWGKKSSLSGSDPGNGNHNLFEVHIIW